MTLIAPVDAARRMIGEDARWAADCAFSTRTNDEAAPFVGLLMTHHFVRIAYEGAAAMRSVNCPIGYPGLVALINDQFPEITARARHVSKLLDDNKKTYADILGEIGAAQARCTAALTGKALRGFRWAETDLGIYRLGEQVIGATTPTAYRLDFDPENLQQMSQQPIQDVTGSWGGIVAVLASADLEPVIESGTLDLSSLDVKLRDRRASRYLGSRYKPQFPDELKLLLLMIEGDLNVNRLMLPAMTPGHEAAVFRAEVVTVYHSLRALIEVRKRFASHTTPDLHELDVIIASADAQLLLCDSGRQIRNRCVHYEIRDSALQLDDSMPMLGIVEAVLPGQSFESFRSTVWRVRDRVAEVLGSWVA